MTKDGLQTIGADALVTATGGVNAYEGLGDLEAPILRNCRYTRVPGRTGFKGSEKFVCDPGARRVKEGDRFYFFRGNDEQ